MPAAGQAGSLRRILTACGETDPARLTAWLDALSRARSQPGKRTANGDVPYRGLASFEREDAPWFFGWEDVVQRLFELGRVLSFGPSGGRGKRRWHRPAMGYQSGGGSGGRVRERRTAAHQVAVGGQ